MAGKIACLTTVVGLLVLLAVIGSHQDNSPGSATTARTATEAPPKDPAKELAGAHFRPFTGNLSDYPKYAVTDQVSIGQWSYKLIRPALLFPVVYGPHREFQPETGGGLRLGDTETTVFSIELAVRNNADVSRRLPPFTIISDADGIGLIDVDQFSAGYIGRHLDSSVVFGPGEQLIGVIAFECCVKRGSMRYLWQNVFPEADPDSQMFLHVSGGCPSGESALISLTQQPAAPPPPAALPPSGEPPSDDAISPPILLSKVEPEYSEEARRANFNGDVRAAIVVDEHGKVVGSVALLDSPGLGLDEKVAAAVGQWRFQPAMKGGVPVTSSTVVKVTFTQR